MVRRVRRRHVFDRLGDRVGHWLTMCEPMSIAHHGHTVGALAPGLQDVYTGLRVAHHILRRPRPGRPDLPRERRRSGEIGIIHGDRRHPAGLRGPGRRRRGAAGRRPLQRPLPRRDHARAATRRRSVEWWGEAWPDDRADGDLEAIATPIDFIGVDYYCQLGGRRRPRRRRGSAAGAEEIGAAGPLGDGMARMLKGRVVPHEGPETGIGWPITPDGLGSCLRWLRDRYDNPPIIITEIGAAFPDQVAEDGSIDDPDRIAYYRDHLVAAHEAIADGVDLRGCFISSLIDAYSSTSAKHRVRPRRVRLRDAGTNDQGLQAIVGRTRRGNSRLPSH